MTARPNIPRPKHTYRITLTVTIEADTEKDAQDHVFDRLFYYGVKDCAINKTEEIQ